MKHTERHTYTSQFRLDPATQDRLLWIKAALGHILDGAKVSQSTIVRRALAMYVATLENIITNRASTGANLKPQLSRNEGYHIQHHSREQGVHWEGEFPATELTAEDGSFPRWTHLEKKYREMKPKVNDLLAAELEGFKRRAD